MRFVNVFKFKYIGSIFAADAREDYDIDSRIVKVQIRCGQLRNIFNSPDLTQKIKVRLHVADVYSLLTYGVESWTLTKRTMRKLNGENIIMLARITGKSFREEASPLTCTFDLVRSIRLRRFRWLGHILRAGEDRLIYQALSCQFNTDKQGNLFCDAPPHQSMYHLKLIAMDKKHWRSLESSIPGDT